MTGLEVEHNVTLVTTRRAESSWWSNFFGHTEDSALGEENADVPGQELEQSSWPSWSSATKIDKLGCIVAKLPRDFLGRYGTRLESGLIQRRQEDTFKMIKDETQEGTSRKECGGGAEGGPWLELVKPMVKRTDIGRVVSTASGAYHVTCFGWSMEAEKTI